MASVKERKTGESGTDDDGNFSVAITDLNRATVAVTLCDHEGSQLFDLGAADEIEKALEVFDALGGMDHNVSRQLVDACRELNRSDDEETAKN